MEQREPKLIRPVLRTERLVLRPLQPRHAHELFDVVDTERAWLRRWLSFPDRTRTPDDAAAFIGRAARSGRAAVWGLWPACRDGGLPPTLCGSAGLHGVDRDHGTASLGYWMRRGAAGRGLATEAAAAILLWAFDELRMARVAVEAATGNAPSLRVIEKLGFTREGCERSALLVSGRRRRADAFLHAVVRADLRATRRLWAHQCGTARPWAPHGAGGVRGGS